MEIKLNKTQIAELKAMSKFTSTRNTYNLENLIYNGKDERFEVCNGKVAMLLNHKLDIDKTVKYYKVVILKSSILLEKINHYPDLNKIFPDSKYLVESGEYIHNGKSEVIDEQLSVFLSQTDMCMNYKYLLNFPKCDRYIFYKNNGMDYATRPNSNVIPAVFIGNINLGRIKILVMPIRIN